MPAGVAGDRTGKAIAAAAAIAMAPLDRTIIHGRITDP